MDIQGIFDSFSGISDGSLADIVVRFAIAIAILVLGVLLAKLLTGSLRKALEKSKVDKTLISFLCNAFIVRFW
jgi:TctA family transporter